jgi:DNA topoisomerase-1
VAAKQWITRARVGKGFAYRLGDAPITNKEQLSYLKSLRVPPAWRDVKIAANRSAKVLATGVDDAGRLQYIYHPDFRAKQEQAKFERTLAFARALPKLRRQVDKDIARRQLDYRKVMACIVSIMDRTYIRIGNEQYARDNQSYGLTTLRSKHTTVEGDTITFDFVGKSGQKHHKKITNRALAKIVKRLDDLPGYEIFKYYDSEGRLRDVKSTDVNAYIKDSMGEEFSAKDFRTWAGTLLASAELAQAEKAETERERKKIVSTCVKKVARKLGNTPAIARGSYIDPRVIDNFMAGNDISSVRQTVEKLAQSDELSPDERCVLKLLEA